MPGYEPPDGQWFESNRWRTLRAVTRVGSPTTVDEIADELHASRPPDDPIAELEPWDRTHQRLHEVALPALDVAGLIEFDEDRGVVILPPGVAPLGEESTPAEDATRTTPASDGDRAWHVRYLGASVVAIGLVTASMALERFEALAPVVTLGVVATFAAIALAHAIARR